jgi:methyl coenzyme M reductase subunit D
VRDNLPYEQVPGNLQFPRQGIVYYNQFIFPSRLIKPSSADENINRQNSGELTPAAIVAGERRPDRILAP